MTTSRQAGHIAACNDRIAWDLEGRPFQASGQSPFGGHGYEGWWHNDDATRQMVECGVEEPSIKDWEIGYMEQADECEVAQ